MTKLAPLAVVLGLLAGGCKEASTSAPSKDPAKPNSPRKLTVKSPGDQTVTQDRTDEMTVGLDRDNFSGPVAVELKNLPKGVTVETKDLTAAADKNSLTVTIKAAPDAPPVVDHVVQVTARAKDQADLPEATTDFKLTVKSK
ncbi:MAG: hypothetical protein C0501_20900 [Isosphaera sp.]|nr:hypothetical protein [Isosphaera sp.]